tara:strand:- start:166 stop:315 length:150 start_codon:yes stop_codon:yes gene_type:complete
LLAARRISFIFLLDTPQCAIACGVFLWLDAARILSFCSTFLPITVFDRH